MNKNFMSCMKKKKYRSEKFAYGVAIRRMLDGCKKQLYIYITVMYVFNIILPDKKEIHTPE